MKTYRLLSALALFKFAATTAVAGGWGHDDSSSSSDDEPCVKKCKWASKRDAYPELNWWERKFYKEIDLRKNLKCSTDGPGPQGEPECRDYCWGVSKYFGGPCVMYLRFCFGVVVPNDQQLVVFFVCVKGQGLVTRKYYDFTPFLGSYHKFRS